MASRDGKAVARSARRANHRNRVKPCDEKYSVLQNWRSGL